MVASMGEVGEHTGRVASFLLSVTSLGSGEGSFSRLVSRSSWLAMERSSSVSDVSFLFLIGWARTSSEHTRVVGLVRVLLALVEAVGLLLGFDLGVADGALVTGFVGAAGSDVGRHVN
jgi:hypothetical protein